MIDRLSRRDVLGAVAGGVALGVAGCLDTARPDAATPDAATPDAGSGDANGPRLSVARVEQLSAPECACCQEYAGYLRPHLDGALVETKTDDLATTKAEFGVPRPLWSCHTLVLDDYVVEGHVPVDAIATLLADRPDVDGIALPGMPAGSPGMGGQKQGAFRVVSFADGQPGDVYAER